MKCSQKHPPFGWRDSHFFVSGRPAVRELSPVSPARVCLALTLALGLGACADAPTATIEPLRASSSLAVPTPPDAQRLAQGLALAMRDPSIRRQVHGAMRASRFNEHKLVLQELVNKPEGENLLSATAAGLGQSLNSIKTAVASLPPLDFYLPFKTHRQTWKSTTDIYVATTFDPDAPTITAYGTNGQTLILRQDDGVPTVPLIILHPAEPKATRATSLADSSEDLIESPAEGTAASSSITSPSVSGPSKSMLPPPPGDEFGGGGGFNPPRGTYINHFNIQEGDGWFGDSEMQFRSVALAGHLEFVQGLNLDNYFLIADYKCPLGTYAQNGVVEDQGYDGLYLLSPTVYSGSYLTCNGYPATYAINIFEMDGGLLADDDDYGWRIYAAGYYPVGATYNTVYSYYGNTFPFHDYDPAYNRVAYLRITIN